jgi:transcriptional regulator with XRE-family HTH domain
MMKTTPFAALLAAMPEPATPEDIRAWRLEHDLTQTQMALLLGLQSATTITNWEQGHTSAIPFLALALEGLTARLEKIHATR